MGCREFFDANAGNNDRCKALQQQPVEVQIAWELENASAHSPSPVLDEENLIRYWLNPVHYDSQTGTLKVTAFDDASNKGLSVNRGAHVTLEELKGIAQARVDEWIAHNAEKAPRQLIGYSVFAAAEARAVHVPIPPDSRRALAVYDTAKPDDASHADVCQIASNAQGGRSARLQMRNLVNERLQRF